MNGQLEVEAIAAQWLAQYAQAVHFGNAVSVADTILPTGWFRDVLILTWDFRSLEGTASIIAFLDKHLRPGEIRNLQLDEDKFCSPLYVPLEDWVEFVFTFETTIAHGRGCARLARDGDSGQWKAMNVSMMASDLRGHEESEFELGMYGGHTLSWEDVLRDRKLAVESDPHALIIGGGQNGLQVAARFKQMDIPTIVIEMNERIGDNWRKRYSTLTLHTPRNYCTMLYQPYPDNWPLFTPRDKLADWLESYAVSQDLVVWTKSRVEGQPVYDDHSGKWNVTINRDGQLVTIHPSHVVMATGVLGEPVSVSLPNQEDFAGTIMHSDQYRRGDKFTGKHVVVVGAGNSSIDICQDLCFHQAKSVTMVQRSSTCVINGTSWAAQLNQVWPDGVPISYGDFKQGSRSFGLVRKLLKTKTQAVWDREKEVHDKLRKGGLALNMGPEGAGVPALLLERGGGWWLDQGGADLIASGAIRVKQGVTLKSYTKTGVALADDEELQADAVIYATGYVNVRESARKILGDQNIDRVGPVWGLDQEGELRGCFRPTGHPGLWFAVGNFYTGRFMSKHLAIQIKALELGLVRFND